MFRKYTVTSSGSFAGIEIKDGITPHLKLMAAKYPNEARRALGFVGSQTQRDMKANLRQGRAGNTRIPLQSRLSAGSRRAITSKKIVSKTSKGKTKVRYHSDSGRDVSQHIRRKFRYTGRVGSRNRALVRSIGYELNDHEVKIGWLSKSGAKWGEIVQEGRTIPVTQRMRRYYAAIGLPLKRSTRTITMPAAPFVEPYFRSNRSAMIDGFRARFYHNIKKHRA